MTKPPEIPFKVVDGTDNGADKKDSPPAQDEALSALEIFFERNKEAGSLSFPEKQEITRSKITMWVIRTFCIVLGVFSVFVCGVGAWGDVTRLSAMSEMIQLILAAASPVVTFILGYYFATKGSD